MTLLVSDVVGDSLEVIASGPTAPDPSRFEDARRILERSALWERVPSSIRGRLERGRRGEIPETVKSGDPVLRLVRTHVLGTNRTAVAAAIEGSRRLGLPTRTLDELVTGEASAVGRRLAQLALELEDRAPGAVLVAGGETTVTVRAPGHGGRNQEVALAAALELEGKPNVVVAALATDGTDGPTNACGGIVDGETCARARDAGLDPGEALARNDAYPLLAAAGDLLFTGPTGTNVADLYVLCRASRPS